MPEAKLIQMGTLGHDSNITTIARYGNKAQDLYTFSIGDPICELDTPNSDGKYTVTELLTKLLDARSEENIDILVGIVDMPLVDDIFSSTDPKNSAIIVSTQSGLIRSTVTRVNSTIEKYILMEIAAQILAIAYRRAAKINADPEDCEKPWHEQTKSCIFDYSDHLPDTAKKLVNPNICVSCKALFSEHNVGNSIQRSCRRIINLTRQSRWRNLLRDVARNPWFMVVFGGLLMNIVHLARNYLPRLEFVPCWLQVSAPLLIFAFVLVILGFNIYKRIPSLTDE